jgi:UDP-N-acetylmuramoyl-L-alanyl-D-glutamate--2,6-diaminopimelate ligase
MNPKSDVIASDAKVTEKSVSFNMACNGKSVPVRMSIGGAFNVYNALSAAAVGVALGLDLNTISMGLAKATSVPGRFESVECGQDFGVIVDYAHTPDELENVLQTARTLTNKRLIAVFGCGGNRDKGKRPIMGKIGVDMADIAVITSDNPRKEDPDAIIKDILDGIPEDKKSNITIKPDRAQAICEAINMAETGDLVVIAGKGHEDYQIFANRTIHFDDREKSAQALELRVKS